MAGKMQLKPVQGAISKPGREWPAGTPLPDPVELPVCPVCGHVGKYPGPKNATFACVGDQESRHKRIRMITIRFSPDPADVEVR